MNTILIGHAEEIDLVQPKVRAMLANDGIYIGGDAKHPGVTVPLVSMNSHVFSMKIDSELEPDRFLPTLTLRGPFSVGYKSRDLLLEEALRNLIAQIELHTDCMDGTIDSNVLVDWVDEAEEVLGYGVTPEYAAKAQHFINVWIDASTELPDAETTVLVCIRGASEPVWLGYYNGDEWKDVEGMVIDVTHWAEIPEPPSD